MGRPNHRETRKPLPRRPPRPHTIILLERSPGPGSASTVTRVTHRLVNPAVEKKKKIRWRPHPVKLAPRAEPSRANVVWPLCLPLVRRPDHIPPTAATNESEEPNRKATFSGARPWPRPLTYRRALPPGQRRSATGQPARSTRARGHGGPRRVRRLAPADADRSAARPSRAPRAHAAPLPPPSSPGAKRYGGDARAHAAAARNRGPLAGNPGPGREPGPRGREAAGQRALPAGGGEVGSAPARAARRARNPPITTGPAPLT